MDPVTALLAGYLATVAQATSNEIFSQSDLSGTTETVETQGFRVTFWHQVWKIRDESVCQGYRHDVLKLSACSKVAKNLFMQTCDRLNAQHVNHPNHRNLKRMYCTAADTYQPKQASVERTTTPNTEDDEARQACQLARAALLGENTAENRYLKQQACKKTEP